MSPEGKSGSRTRIRLNQNLKTQLKFDELVRAVGNGACGATYDGDSGETVIYTEPPDKDRLEELLSGYTSLIQQKGVGKKATREVTSEIRERFDMGTAREQQVIFNSIKGAVQALIEVSPNPR